jgi:hemerythrin superfamily protein
MARAAGKDAKTERSRSKTDGTDGADGAEGQDAIELLKADHRDVERWFDEFEQASSDAKKSELADRICTALKTHTALEEEIFYPAFLEATKDEETHHKAEVEHEAAKKLIEDLEASGPDDDYFDAKMQVLCEMITHHVEEEEGADGMFSMAEESDMDLEELGAQIAQRKAELMGEDAERMPRRGEEGDEAARSRHV